MCKFNKPQIPADATADERRSIMWNALSSLDLSDKCEKRDNLTYLSWANAISEFRNAYPSATYRIVKNPTTGLPYFVDPNGLGIMCFVEVTVDGITSEAWLPVMDNKNKAMRLEAYTYQVWDSYKKAYVEKTVAGATMTDINRCLMRTLVKAISIATSIGLYIYAGEDVPEKSNDEATPQPKLVAAPQPLPQPQAPVQQSEVESLKQKINSTTDVSALVSLYLESTQVIENNPELKSLLTNRKKALQTLNS